jgi:hypothetical protein
MVKTLNDFSSSQRIGLSESLSPVRRGNIWQKPLGIEEHSSSVNLIKHLPTAERIQSLDKTDMYMRNISTQIDNNMLKELLKKERIKNFRLSREVSKRDAIIFQHLPNNLDYLA